MRNIKPIRMVALAAIAASLFTRAATQTAHADASGAAGWGALTISVGGQSVGIPSGLLTHNIEGQGANIGLQSAFFASAGTISNWRIDWINIDVNGIEVNRSQGPIHLDSGHEGDRIADFRPGSVPVAIGTACAALIVSGQEIVRQCHAITP